VFVFSAKRCELYKEFVEFTDSDSLKLLRYCSTRWLSLLSCIERVLNQWAALQVGFVIVYVTPKNNYIILV